MIYGQRKLSEDLMKKDPVCRMDVKEEEAITAECNDEIFYFCSEGCKEKFFKERECKCLWQENYHSLWRRCKGSTIDKTVFVGYQKNSIRR